MACSEHTKSNLIAIVSAPTSKQWSGLLFKIAIMMISPLLLIGLLEGIAYFWERKQANGPYAWELVASRRLVWEPFPEPGTGYTLMKPGSHYEWQKIPVDINSHGLRGPETTYEMPAAMFRLLNLGDSVAMGWGVREEDTYGRRLESQLNERADGERYYEVINAGVPGWNPKNAVAYLQGKGLQYKPDLILIELTLANDIKGGSALLAEDQRVLIKWLRDNTYFWPFLTVQLRWLEARTEGQKRIDVLEPPTNPDKYFPPTPESEQWTNVWDSVLAINRLAGENNASIILAIFPLEFQVLDENYPTLPQELFKARAAEAGIPVLDLLPAFQKACREKPGGSCYLEDRYLFADVWMHPSAYGHQIAAAEIETILTQILP